MQVVERRREQAAKVVEPRLEHAAEMNPGCSASSAVRLSSPKTESMDSFRASLSHLHAVFARNSKHRIQVTRASGEREEGKLKLPPATGWKRGQKSGAGYGRAYSKTLATAGSLASRHSIARRSAKRRAPGDEAVRLTLPIDCKPVECSSWVRHPCLAASQNR